MLRGFILGVVATSVVLFLIDWGGDLKNIQVAGFSPARWLDANFGSGDAPPPEPESLTSEPVLAEEPAPALPTFEPAPAESLPSIDLAPAPPAPPAVTLIPEFVMPGILFDYTGNTPLAPFTVVTSPGQDYYVKLVYEGTSSAAIGIYVQGGISNEVLVPLGRYEMRYAAGTTWYGLADLFGPDTAYAKALDVLDFREEANQYSGYTIELILQEDGNLDTQPLGPGEF